MRESGADAAAIEAELNLVSQQIAKFNSQRAAAELQKGPIANTVGEPSMVEMLKAVNAPLPDLEQQREISNKAQEAIDAIFSGDARKSEVARKALQFASPELLNRVGQKLNERMRNITRASLNNAAGAPRFSMQ